MTDIYCQYFQGLAGDDKAEQGLRILQFYQVNNSKNLVNTGYFSVTISSEIEMSHECRTTYCGLCRTKNFHKDTSNSDETLDLKDLPF